MNKPKFFIIGNPKSGTTALYTFLKKHPSIFMPDFKEPHYFAKDLCCASDRRSSFYPMSEQQYLDLFREAQPDQLCGEASTNYLYSHVAAKEIHAFAPDAKIILILREPIDFLESYHLELLKVMLPTEAETVKDFKKALTLESARKIGKQLPGKHEIPELLYYAERIKYVKQIKRFQEYFDEGQIKIIIYDDWKQNNQKVYQDILSFLEVDNSFLPEKFHNYNQGGKIIRFKSMKISLLDLVHGEKYWQPLKVLIKLAIPQQFRRAMISWLNQELFFTSSQPLQPELKVKLKSMFKEEVRSLSKILDQDLMNLWEYNNLN